MRIKTDYMGNDKLLPAYNVQIGVADEYIAVVDVNHYRSDMDCFIPLMEHFKQTYVFLKFLTESSQVFIMTLFFGFSLSNSVNKCTCIQFP